MMNWFSCAGNSKKKGKNRVSLDSGQPISGSSNIAANTFTFKELANATRNFRDDCLLGEGNRGRVYKGQLDSKQVVAIRHVDQSANRKFLVEVLMLSLLHHPNIVNLIGYCADEDQRLLVYEYLPLGSLKDCLRESSPGEKQLDWNTRINIALGAAKGLEHLHDKSQPPVIHRSISCSNILLDEGFQAKLSDFGLAKLGPMGGKNYVSVKFEEGNIGYSAPEYATERKLSVKSDIYSFGVVLLEIFTGRKAIQNSKDGEEWNLVAWARPLIEDRKFSDMVELKIQGHYPERGLQQVLAVAGMCVQEQPIERPATAEVVTFLTYIAAGKYDFEIKPVQSSNLEHLLNS